MQTDATSRPLLALPVVLLTLLGGCGNDLPAWCAPADPLPFEAGCSGPHCVLGLIVDYKRVEPRGFKLFALDGAPIDRVEAEKLARDHVVNTLGAEEPTQTECDRAENFFHCAAVYPTSDRYRLVYHGPTGRLLFAGLEEWAISGGTRGADVPLPEGFSDATRFGCGTPLHEPARKQLVTTEDFGPQPQTAPSTPRDALAAARRSVAALRFVGNAAYHAFVITYAPNIGGIDPESTDWHVWLYRLP